MALLDNEDMNAVDGDDDWQFVSIGEQQNFGIRTAGLEEKATACQMLVCYARELKDGFADYTEQVSPAMLHVSPTLDTYILSQSSVTYLLVQLFNLFVHTEPCHLKELLPLLLSTNGDTSYRILNQ